MKELMEKHLRPCRRWSDILPIAAVLSVVAASFGVLFTLPVSLITQMPRLLRFITGSEDVAKFMMQYYDFIGIWIMMLLIFWIFRPNRPMLRAIRHDHQGNTVKWLLIGLALGFGTNGFCILISALTGKIKLYFNEFSIIKLLLLFVFVFIQSGAEELVMRCYLYQKLRRRYPNPLVAIIGNALIFSLMHLPNPGFNFSGAMQIFVVGIVFSLLVYYFGSFWAACAMHAGWNFTQNILFGLPNSGNVAVYSLFKLDAASATNGFFYNVGFGVEGSPGSTVVLAVCGVILFLIGRKGTYREDLWKDAEAAAIAEKAAMTAKTETN
ncbi:MAG: CPBP family intramembrane metalloprotease [Lachnospiraceae bacterium]|nr:CPBP family intramembrane metalloprotease [Lachnospiraceae bacterium]